MDVDVTILWMVCANAWGLCGRQVHLLEQVLYMKCSLPTMYLRLHDGSKRIVM